MSSIGEKLKAHWLALGTDIRPGLSENELQAFETRHNVRLPSDMREYFHVVDGNGYDMDKEWLFCFWSLERVAPVSVASPECADFEHADRFFVFADHSISVFEYAIRLSETGAEPSAVLSICPGGHARPRQVADSFSEFAEKYLSDPADLL